jgi:hypothetical protein
LITSAALNSRSGGGWVLLDLRGFRPAGRRGRHKQRLVRINDDEREGDGEKYPAFH